MIIESAHDRLIRILAGSVGIGSVAFTLLGIGSIIDQHPYLDTQFSIISVVLFCGIPIVFGLFAYNGPIRLLKVLAATHITVAGLVLAFWVPALTAPLPHDELPWILDMITVATSGAAIVLSPIPGWFYLGATAVAAGLVRYGSYGGGDALIAFQHGVMMAVFSSVMLALLQLTLRAGREQDAAALAAQQVAATVATAEVLEFQRSRYQSFTHDNVLATLLAAARNTPGTLGITRRSANSALLKLNEFRDEVTLGAEVKSEMLASLLSAATLDTDVEIQIHDDEAGRALRTPVVVADALASAVAEALRNSIRHADWPDLRPVRRDAVVTFSATGIEIVVTDNGQGFNPRRIGADRLGVRVSILDRVNSLRGCRASIQSSPGKGTTVSMSWTPPSTTARSSA